MRALRCAPPIASAANRTAAERSAANNPSGVEVGDEEFRLLKAKRRKTGSYYIDNFNGGLKRLRLGRRNCHKPVTWTNAQYAHYSGRTPQKRKNSSRDVLQEVATNACAYCGHHSVKCCSECAVALCVKNRQDNRNCFDLWHDHVVLDRSSLPWAYNNTRNRSSVH